MPSNGIGTARGVEVLHLIGNAIFLVGVVTLFTAANAAHATTRDKKPVKIAVWIQAMHVAEHICLTTSLFVIGSPYGISTMFGFGDTSASLTSTHRIWWHFLINLAATTFALVGLWRLRRAGMFQRPQATKDPAPEAVGSFRLDRDLRQMTPRQATFFSGLAHLGRRKTARGL